MFAHLWPNLQLPCVSQSVITELNVGIKSSPLKSICRRYRLCWLNREKTGKLSQPGMRLAGRICRVHVRYLENVRRQEYSRNTGQD